MLNFLILFLTSLMFVLLFFKHSEEKYQSSVHYKHEQSAQVICTLVSLLFQVLSDKK